MVDIHEIETRDIYLHIIIHTKCKPPTSQAKWIQAYPEIELLDEDWNNIYSLPFKLTRNTKVQMVQYKIINRILAVNRNLKKWKRISNDTCSTCNKMDDTEHYIYSCEPVRAFWNNIQTWWKASFDFNINLSILEILFGIPNENEEHILDIYNLVILYAKYYIYVSKKKEKKLDLYDYLLDLKNEMHLKKTFYTECNKIQQFDKKWGELYDNL